ncbi:MAG: hypothetical protein GYA34_09480 [Chloroflexi bacterium]|nr:hypothetical protein [Chloroflexota bacterium]
MFYNLIGPTVRLAAILGILLGHVAVREIEHWDRACGDDGFHLKSLGAAGAGVRAHPWCGGQPNSSTRLYALNWVSFHIVIKS